jgi:alpha-L-fucosidase
MRCAAFLLIILFLIMNSMQPIQAQTSQESASLQQTETTEQRNARMAWWREARFGMFIHWGVYSVPAGSYNGKPVAGLGEWIMNKGKIPVAEYAKYPAQFNPVQFDAEKWVTTAQNAGMKYIVITAKHHDGFAMFHSHVDGYNIYDATPFKRDPLAELAEACRKHDMKLGFYYSQAQDWHHPGGAANGGRWDKAAQDGDMDKYIRDIAAPQVKELLTNYGPVAVLWWDTPTDMTLPRAEMLLPLLKLQPQIITNNRLGAKLPGDTETPEQRIPPTGSPGKDWETCMTINDTWGYKSDDTKFKTTETLLRNLIDISSKGGNYLLNVGPTSLGVIPEPEVQRITEMGKWLKTNGEAIYGTGPTPFGAEAGELSATEKDRTGKPSFIAKWDWRCTSKPGKLYIHIFKWPENGKFVLENVKGIGGAHLLADPNRAISWNQVGDKIEIALPGTAPDPIASVLCLEIGPGIGADGDKASFEHLTRKVP